MLLKRTLRSKRGGSGPVSPDRSLTERRLAVMAVLAHDATAVEVVSALRARNVRAILLKGPAIAARLYDDPGERLYSDVDLLIEQSSLENTAQVLSELGFRDRIGNPRASEVAPHASTWVRSAPRWGNVDLHTGIHFCTQDPEALWEEFTRRTREIELGRSDIEVLGDAPQAFVIVTHALADCRHPKTLEDLQRALVRIDRESWREAAAIASRLGALSAFATGLCRAEAGQRLVDELGLEYESTAEMFLHLEGFPPVADGLSRLARASSARARIRLIVDELAPSPDFMRLAKAMPFARWGPAGLALAYLYRPLWLLSQTPGGLRAWRAASVGQRRAQGPRAPRRLPSERGPSADEQPAASGED